VSATATETPPPTASRRPGGKTLAIIAGFFVIAGIAIAGAAIAVSQGNHVSSLTTTNSALSRQLAAQSQQIARLSAEQAALNQAAQTRQGAVTASLGVCETDTTETLNNYSPPVTVITSVSIASPSLVNGVASCPYGSFVPVAPQTSPGG